MQDNVTTLYVTALNPSVQENTLREVFSAYGRVGGGLATMGRSIGQHHPGSA